MLVFVSLASIFIAGVLPSKQVPQRWPCSPTLLYCLLVAALLSGFEQFVVSLDLYNQ
jgi:hypothetical protein